MTLTNCTISGNQSSFGGGIVNFGTLYSTNNTITNNTASSCGGGVSSIGASATFENTIIAGNSAEIVGPDCRW